jgi:hypothetical protein
LSEGKNLVLPDSSFPKVEADLGAGIVEVTSGYQAVAPVIPWANQDQYLLAFYLYAASYLFGYGSPRVLHHGGRGEPASVGPFVDFAHL